MMPRVRRTEQGISFKCPGCGDNHAIPTTGPHAWGFNGNYDRPTLTPSVLVRSGHYAPHWKQGDACWCGKDYGFECYRCHSFVENGQIRFLADCTHKLAGQTVDLAEVEQ